jgi:hypothetical protein
VKFQLVLQFNASTLQEFDHLATLEDLLYKNLPPKAVVDGHDFGLDEYNVFIHTDDPRAALAHTQSILETHHLFIPFLAGYRDFNEEIYIPIWPLSLDSFNVS